MSATYYVEISRALLLQTGGLPEVKGFRLVEEVVERGAYRPRPDVALWKVEDDGAPPWLEGRLVTPTFRQHYGTDGEPTKVAVLSREIYQ
jgi:hypothetical protein